MDKGRLFLIPVPLGSVPADLVLPSAVQDCARRLTHFIAENAKSARAFLKSLPCDTPLQQIEIRELNEHTAQTALPELLTPLHAGFDVGLISEAGCPAIADPGAGLVALAHLGGISVHPLTGPSSILLALMGSGLSGQNFAFHGYLPKNGEQLRRTIFELERDSRQGNRTQIFIETPYRNRQMLETLIRTCSPETRICVATDLTLGSQCIATRTPSEWREQGVSGLDRRPSVFLIQA